MQQLNISHPTHHEMHSIKCNTLPQSPQTVGDKVTSENITDHFLLIFSVYIKTAT